MTKKKYIDVVLTAFNCFVDENIDVLLEHEEGFFTEINKFYVNVDLTETSDSVEEPISGITVDFWQKKRYYVALHNLKGLSPFFSIDRRAR